MTSRSARHITQNLASNSRSSLENQTSEWNSYQGNKEEAKGSDKFLHATQNQAQQHITELENQVTTLEAQVRTIQSALDARNSSSQQQS